MCAPLGDNAMKTIRLIIAFAALTLGLGLLTAHAEPPKDSKAPSLPLCPVMDEPVNFYIQTDTKDGPVYFCCKKCIAEYEKEPAKFADKVAAQRKALHALPAVQVACPISDHPVDKK